ncbi:unnamed protein product, partial [Oppiella nova]
MAGALLLIGQMADAIASPFVGFQSDRMPDIWIFRYGRRKFWHLLGVIMNTVTVPFIYNTPCFPGDCSGSSTIGRFAYYAVLIIIFQAGWAATQVSHVSLIVDLTDDTNERIALNAYRQMADAIASPFVGFQSDRMPDIWIFRYGRRKFWHLLGVIMNTVTVPFIYNTPCFPGDCSGSSTIGRFAYYAVLIIIFQAGWAATQVSHVSLIVDLTDNTNERIALNAYRQAATIFANICLYTVTLFVIGFDSNETISQDDLDMFTMVSYIVCVIGLVFSLLFHVFVAEPVVPKEEHKPRGLRTASAFSVDTQRALFQHRASIIAPIYTPDSPDDSDDTGSVDESTDVYHLTGKITIMYTMARMFFNLGQVYSPLYLQYSLQMPKNTIAIMPFATYVAGLVCSFGAKPFSARYGARWVLIIGVAFGVGSCVWIFIGGNTESYKLWQIYVVSALL